MKRRLLSALLTGMLIFSAVPYTASTVSAGGWYTTSMNDEQTVMTVTVSLGADANWEMVQTSGSYISPLTYEIVDGVFYGSFMANGGGSGMDSLELLFMVSGISYGYCRVNLNVSDSGQLDVTNGYVNIDDYNGDGGYYPTDDDSSNKPGGEAYSNFVVYYVTANGLTLRSNASSGSAAIDSLAYGSAVNVGEIINGWAVVLDYYGNRIGYASAQYLSEQKPGQDSDSSDTHQVPVNTYYVIAESGLTVRELPSLSAAATGSFNYGDAVSVIEIKDGWATLVDLHNSQWSGYCSAQYLSTKKPGSTSSGSAETVVPVSVTGQSTSEDETAEEKPWFEMSTTGKTLTIRLPEEDKADWEYKISDKTAFELLTEETTKEGSEEYWVASFIGTGKKSGNIDLFLKRRLEDKSIDLYYSLELAVSEDGIMRVVTAEKPWFETDDNGILTLMLPANQGEGYDWYEEVADTTVAELINSTFIEQEDELDDGLIVDGYWNGSYRGLQEGETDLTMTYRATDEAENVRTLKLAVDSDNNIKVTEVEEIR